MPAAKTAKKKPAAKPAGKPASTKANEMFAALTDKILAGMREALANGTVWRAPWQKSGASSLGLPINAKTRKAYKGGNVMALWFESMDRGYVSGFWATYNQWTELGLQVRKGQKGTTLIKWSPVEDKKSPPLPNGKFRTRMIPYVFSVFNRDQVDGEFAGDPQPVDEAPGVEVGERIAVADEFFAAVGAELHHGGDGAYYSPVRDFIQMPHFDVFHTGIDYYSTLAHEHIHWSGHDSRIKRDLSGRFGDAKYAMEELIAELGAAFTMATLGLVAEPREDHALYLASWIKALEKDEKAVFAAAGKAQEALNFLMTTAHWGELEAEADEVATDEVAA